MATDGGHGYSTLELLVMETGVTGPLNPRHPFSTAEEAKARDRTQLLRDRMAYYDVKRRRQSASQAESPKEAGQGQRDLAPG